MSGFAFFPPQFTLVNSSGRPYAGAVAQFFRAGTSTGLTVYTDASLATPHGTSVTASSTGVFPPVFIDPAGGDYKVSFFTSGGSLIRTVDNLPVTDTRFDIAAIPRCSAGVFSLLDDANHEPVGASSITHPDAFTIRLNYEQAATQVNSLVVGADDALAPYGVIAGGDVGTSYANILAFAPFNAYVTGEASPTLTLNSLWHPGIAAGSIAVTKVNASQVRITHTESVTGDPVVVSLVSATLPRVPTVSFSNSQIDIIMAADAEGYIAYGGSTWAQSNSDNLTAPTLTWTGDNVLRVDHGIAGTPNRVPMLTGHGGTYVPQIAATGDTYFEVAFYGYDGVKVTTPDTNMKFWYRKDLLVASTWPTSTVVSVRRGLCKVPVANFSNVSGNNLWVIGQMQA